MKYMQKVSRKDESNIKGPFCFHLLITNTNMVNYTLRSQRITHFSLWHLSSSFFFSLPKIDYFRSGAMWLFFLMNLLAYLFILIVNQDRK